MRAVFAHDHIFYKYNDVYYSNGGLPSSVLKRYTQIFEEVHVLSRQKEISFKDDNLSLATCDNIEFINIPNFKSISKISNIKYAKKIIYSEIEKSDCLIARLPSAIGHIAIKYAKKLNKPYLVEVVGCSWDSGLNYGNIVGKVFAPIGYLQNRYDIKHSKYTSYITKQFLQSRYPAYHNIEILPNVNIKSVDENILSNRLLKIDNIDIKNEIVFGTIGSLDVGYKGHETIIKAFSIIKDKIPNFRIEFLGKGSKGRWEELSKKYGVYENIKFIGTLPSGEAVYNWIDSIDISLQPSLAEAQGRSIIESMSRGCPVIASRVGGIVELIDDEWLINAKDYNALAEKILNLISNKEQIKLQSKTNFKKSKEYYKIYIDKKRFEFLKDFRLYCEKSTK